MVRIHGREIRTKNGNRDGRRGRSEESNQDEASRQKEWRREMEKRNKEGGEMREGEIWGGGIEKKEKHAVEEKMGMRMRKRGRETGRIGRGGEEIIYHEVCNPVQENKLLI